jgi:hypothetical protein
MQPSELIISWIISWIKPVLRVGLQGAIIISVVFLGNKAVLEPSQVTSSQDTPHNVTPLTIAFLVLY